MKKLLLTFTAFIAAAPLIFASGAAFASTSYTPVLVKQFNTESDTSFEVQSIVPVNDSIAVLNLANNDLWLTDGTTAGTTELETLAAADGLSNWNIYRGVWSTEVVSDGAGKLYFWGFGSVDEEWNIWSFNGTEFDQVTTDGFVNRDSLYFLGGELYAQGKTLASSIDYNALNHVETSNGAVYEIAGGNGCDGINDNIDGVIYVNGRIIFLNDAANECDYELISWDPANPLTSVANLSTATDASADFDDWESRGVFEGEMYFSGSHSTLGFELWATDGTVAGTRLVKDINPDGGDSSPGDNGYIWFTEFEGELYFSAYDGDDRVLYKTDGTTGGTVQAVDGVINPGDCVQFQGLVVGDVMFTDFDCELYVTDGDTATQLTDDLGGMCYDYCALPVAFDSHVFFNYYDGTNNSVWVTDGTPAGTVEVTNFGDPRATADSSDFSLVQVGSRLLFNVNDQEEDGGTGEIALYAIGEAELANTGANVDGLALAGLIAVVAGAGVYAVRRRATV